MGRRPVDATGKERSHGQGSQRHRVLAPQLVGRDHAQEGDTRLPRGQGPTRTALDLLDSGRESYCRQELHRSRVILRRGPGRGHGRCERRHCPLVRHQVLRHKLVDMATAIMALRAQLERIAWQVDAGTHPIADVCMTKNLATQTLELCAKESVQILGGAGYLRGTAVERIYRETKVLSIGGGAEEIMKELAAKQLGIV